MFTGIIQQIGIFKKIVKKAGSGRIFIELSHPISDLIQGESIAINGVCLSLEKAENNKTLSFFTLRETLAKTNLGKLKSGDKINIERALKPHDRLGGHIITGHIDCTANIKFTEEKGNDLILKVSSSDEIKEMVVKKGCIAIDGVSLTIVECSDEFFTVHLIPETRKRTNLEFKKQGDFINIETDIIAKYVKQSLSHLLPNAVKQNISYETLIESGWNV